MFIFIDLSTDVSFTKMLCEIFIQLVTKLVCQEDRLTIKLMKYHEDINLSVFGKHIVPNDLSGELDEAFINYEIKFTTIVIVLFVFLQEHYL